ncbi:hypothetical protein PVL29_020597 [Vitis rotundifolia]|uniref:Uncharacterized protein n=1 Tax=Vitis rotundifolia TaxID=103349 RepID=A0AA38YXK9_VITRO|nr:hypothetical protein PVL29_020597 [Vitis rotundifolia]
MIGGRGGVVGGWRWGLHHLHGVVQRVNDRNGPFVGLLMTSPTEEIALQVSGLFVPSSDFPLHELAGRRLNIGKIKGVDVIYVMSGEQMKGALSKLKFEDYNLPIKGEKLLAELKFTLVQLYTTRWPKQELFCLEIDPNDMNKQQTPRLRGSSAHIFVDNAAYNEFLFKTLNISTVDEESATIVMVKQVIYSGTSMSNGVPSVVFRGISDTAGMGGTLSSSSFSLAAINAVRVVVEFIGLLGREGKVHDH